MTISIRRFLVVISVMSLVLAGAAAPAPSVSWIGKVDPWVLDTASNGPTEFLLFMSSQADLTEAQVLPTRLEKGRYVYQTLTSLAAVSQRAVLAELDDLGVPYRPYWIANMVWVRADLPTIRLFAQRPDVAHLYANPRVALEPPVSQSATTTASAGIEWNIDWVHAPAVWALGYTGQGVVIGGQDTGYIWDHPALKNAYRGWDGSSAQHDYNWYDATLNPSAVPVDPYGHGTHTMGIMVGDDGLGNQVGMAPGARWIGCRNMDANGVGSPATYSACYQWFVAPTRLDGSDPRYDLAPDVISNSWSCPVEEGCTDPGVLQTVVHNLVAAGIVSAHSAGNSGYAGCGTIDTPAAIYTESFTVGATGYLTDTIASFSSRGPVTIDGSNLPKPDVSAPGVLVRSSYLNNDYVRLSGTSMASPHVAGLVALLISAYPALRGHVDQIETTIEQSALHVASTDCDSQGIPNNLYGWGRIDALAAYSDTQMLALDKQASSVTIEPGDLLTYTLTISHVAGIDPTTNVVLTDTLPTGSSFIAATMPYTRTADTLRWDFPLLPPGGAISVELVVRSDPASLGALTNFDYAVHSDQVHLVRGAPVITLLGELYFVPIFMSSDSP